MNQAICVLNFTDDRKGLLYFYIEYGKLHMLGLFKNIGLRYGKLKGLHIHKCGDLSNGCESACAHYDPNNEHHGSLNSKHRHSGDLGKGTKRYIQKLEDINNIILTYLENTNSQLCAKIMGNHEMLSAQLENEIRNDLIELRKNQKDKTINKINEKIRKFVISKIAESKKTGNSGKRIGCGVIGYCEKKNFEKLISDFFY